MIGISMSARAGTRQPFEWDRLFLSTIVRGTGHASGLLDNKQHRSHVKIDTD